MAPLSIVEKLLILRGSVYTTKWFTRELKTNLAKVASMNKEKMVLLYKVPKELCRSGQCHTGALTAIFDELSTTGYMLYDKSHRWGVSVTLNTKLVAPIKSEEEIEVEITYDKMGKTLGFCSMNVYNTDKQNRKLVGVGSHCKYMLLPPMLEFFMSFSWVLHFLLDAVFDFNKKVPAKSILGWGQKYLPSTEEVKQIETAQTIPRKEGEVIDAIGLEPIAGVNNSFSFTVNKKYLNPGGNVHGGATAMAVEEALRKQAQTQGEEMPVVNNLTLTYLKALIYKKDNPVTIEIYDQSYSTFDGSNIVKEGRVCQGGSTCVKFEATCKA